ncbi:putative PilL-like protein (plasmid) [Cupriavidus necator H850]|uniref:pilus assembly protein PilL n=1 Tax=Cupriavidus necator TaxID=106590 RepID=UPI00129D32B1|nr:pilus assembly protein PilL [Cupriavidus necator]KAI3602983.1 putative PilL-like protein [Cupriavidus necator H850]
MIRPLILSTLVLTASANAVAADTDPLDFDYQVIARAVDRPALIFNDGLSTYIQPRPGQAVQAEGALQTGPYWVVDGVPDVVRYSVNGQSVVARWKRANGFTAEPANPGGDLPTSLAAITGRLALLGSYADLPLVRAGRSSLPLAQMVKSIAPVGWTGTARKDISLTDDVSLDARAGENWLQALARVLEQRNLYAEVDFTRRHISLRDSPPKAFSVQAKKPAASVGMLQASAPASEGSTSGTATPAGIALPEGLTLASAFEAIAIRDTKKGRIEIRFDQEPKGLEVRDPSGSKLRTNWDEAERVLSLPTVDSFTVVGSGKTVEVARVPGIHYLFPSENDAGLERVFEKDGATYLSFAKSMANISVFGENRQGSGEQKDRYYKFNGISAHLTVIADGAIVQVDRLPEVRFYERGAP